jgi:hypothetical protein
MRPATPASWPCTLACLAGCAGSLNQVPADQPHGILELRFEQVNRELPYDTRVSIDGGEEVAVTSGQRVRLAPGTHSIELVAIAHAYGAGTIAVTKPGACVDPQCTRQLTVTDYQPALVETGQQRCSERLEVGLDSNWRATVVLRVAADQTCSGYVVPAGN